MDRTEQLLITTSLGKSVGSIGTARPLNWAYRVLWIGFGVLPTAVLGTLGGIAEIAKATFGGAPSGTGGSAPPHPTGPATGPKPLS